MLTLLVFRGLSNALEQLGDQMSKLLLAAR
jgi:hypothetical protein